MSWTKPPAPKLEPRLRAILDQDFPTFSDAEMARRRALLDAAIEQAGVSHVLLCGAGFRGSAVPWFKRWPVSTEVVCVVTPGERDAMFVQYFNHLPQATRLAVDADVAWGGASTIHTVADELSRRGAAGQRVGIIGPLGFGQRDALAGACGEVVNLNPAYVKMRLVKSAEEIDWFRIGGALSDLAIDALRAELRPGLTEHDLSDIVEHSYVPWGGKTVIHFFGVTPMAEPNLQVPAQFTSVRPIRAGDVVFTEISAVFWDYSGQVLRTFTVAEQPTPLYRDLHDAAQGAFDAITAVLRPGARPEDIVEAATVIEDAGFTTCDDLVHGYGGGYFPPILGSKSRPNEPLPDMTLEAGMMMVVQPNVITPDERAGVQTGECVLITEEGCESLHNAPRGLFVAGP